ncbi:MAG: dynamin family protein [Thermodesulfobacteria bacterium]|nr:dynamin family protein [Thermodesulfobacteriota bacterium]
MQQSVNIRAKELKEKIEGIIPKRLSGVFECYGFSIDDLMTPIKWKPLVLIIGNYSSGKSTFINEFLGMDVQRTGQAPTDDSFTILTAPEEGESPGDLTGSTVVADERFPFGGLRKFGEKLLSHLVMKRIDSDKLKDIAIIDTPGMLDSVTEQDRGYDFLGVIGELARLSDLIVLMFDPHKAGTIKETYKVLRMTLPASAGEDRVLFVLNRIDECENLEDLVRAYGTLCWNLSQMTGRKDIPRIYLTYAKIPGKEVPQEFKVWEKEREELKKALMDAPRMRLFHMLQEVDRAVRELGLVIRAMDKFKEMFVSRLKRFVKSVGIAAVFAFLMGDLVMNLLTGYPSDPFLLSLVTGNLGVDTFLWPIIWFLFTIGIGSFYFQKITFPRFIREVASNPDRLVELKSAYDRDLWERVRHRVAELIDKDARHQIWVRHKRNLARLEKVVKTELQSMYDKVRMF